jgi:hypothetical protein
MAQEKSPKSTIDDVVKQCVDGVHRFPADKSDLSFFKKFDAFYNSAAGRVENNAFLDGDLPALYQFNKCMASQGRKGSPSSDRTNVFGLKPRSHKRAASYPLRSCRHLRSPTKPAQRHSGQAVFPRRWRVATPRRITFDRIKADFCAWSKCRAEHSFPLMISAGAKIPH